MQRKRDEPSRNRSKLHFQVTVFLDVADAILFFFLFNFFFFFFDSLANGYEETKRGYVMQKPGYTRPGKANYKLTSDIRLSRFSLSRGCSLDN